MLSQTIILTLISLLQTEGSVNPLTVLSEDKFQRLMTVESIPDSVWQSFYALTRDSSVAEPNEEFNATDVLLPNLPRKRLVAGFRSQNHFILVYEQGGRGKHVCVLIFSTKDGRTIPIWGGTFIGKGSSVEDLYHLLKSKKIQQRGLSPNSW